MLGKRISGFLRRMDSDTVNAVFAQFPFLTGRKIGGKYAVSEKVRIKL